MYLFKDKDYVEIPFTYKMLSGDHTLTIKITKDEYRNVTKFPIKKEIVRTKPDHKVIVYLNQYLEIENFEIKEVIKKEEISYSKELTSQVLSEVGLSNDEIELYFRVTGREAEMALLSGKTPEQCAKIAEKFVEKGLFKIIIGAQTHYSALPPYAALVKQLQKFHEYISDIKSKIPAQMEKSFKQLESESGAVEKKTPPPASTDLMKELKDNMLSQIRSQKKEFDETLAVMDQIRGISDDISNLEGYTEDVMGTQLEDLKKQFQDINQKTSQIIKGQVSDLKSEFDNIKGTISENLQKLRLGVIQQTVDQVIEKVINTKIKNITDNINVQLSVSQVAFADELKKVTKGLDSELISKLKESIQSTLQNVDGITSKAEEDKEKAYLEIAENFNKAVTMAESKIQGISGTTLESMGTLKDIFANQIVATLDNTLDEILQKLEVSEKVTNEFWERAKSGTSITMKDIWFIRSPESAKSHISEQVEKAKMRVLIVAPQITDIDLKSIKEKPPRVNFRIAASIDLSDPDHIAIVNELDKMDNVDYRHRALMNLWGINRDYEEVIICVLSKTEIKGDMVTEIAGLGSIIEEHIKIFVPILEEAWMGARKEVLHSIKTDISKDQVSPPEMLEEKPLPKPKLEPVMHKPKVMEAPLEEAPKEEKHEVSKESKVVSRNLLKRQFDLIFESIEKSTGLEISSTLEKFQSEFIKTEGYNSILKNMHATSDALRNKTYVLSQPEKEDLRMKMNFWKQKLEL
jgi:hypothetical protein